MNKHDDLDARIATASSITNTTQGAKILAEVTASALVDVARSLAYLVYANAGVSLDPADWAAIVAEPGDETLAYLPLDITDDVRRTLIAALEAGLAAPEPATKAEPLDPWAPVGTLVRSHDGLQHGALDGTYGTDDNAPWVGVVWVGHEPDGSPYALESSRVWIDGLALDDDVVEETPKADTFSALKKGKGKK